MVITETQIKGCYVVECNRHYDSRGFFQELYSDNTYDDLVQRWEQINWSESSKGVFRGIHEAPFNKLVTCLTGEIFDVVVDLRPKSETFKQWTGFYINAICTRQLFVPAGCGHGFLAIEKSQVMYCQNATYKPGQQKSWRWDSFGIEWPVESDFILSKADKNAPTFA